MSATELIARLKISDIIDNEDGTSTLYFDLDDEFVEWFKKKEGLKRFSHKRFSTFVVEALKRQVEITESESKGIVGKIVSEQNT